MDHLKLTVDKLSVDAVSELVVDDSCGAISIFVGTTRDNFEGKKVVRLDYEAYEPMAIKSMKSICDDIRKKWSQVHGIAIYHRLGEVPAREASVIIAISSPHRADSLAAVSHCIDSLKASVPIWKKEVYDGAAPAWKENAECPTIKEEKDRETERGLVQITASDEELMQRIQNFIDRKREQVNLSNVADFTGGGRDAVEAEERDGCARVLAVFHKRKGNDKGHLKMSRVHNEWGPQVKRARPATSLSVPVGPGPLPAAVAERVLGAERYVGLTPVAGDVYRRLKAIEDRIATLEGVSPEYAMFWRVPEMESARVKQELHEECMYTADDIAKKIEMLEGEG